MALYAIADLHLHFGSELKAKSQLKDPVWIDHEIRFKNNCSMMIDDEDTLVLVGDHSWGRNLMECEKDFEYIKSLPGRKILTRGNHDMFWDVNKTEMLNDMFNPDLYFLQGNYETYNDFALIASKGYCFEGPYYLDNKGNIVGYDNDKYEHSKKLIDREAKRLIDSFEKAKADGYRKFIMFIHYPVTNVMEKDSVFTRIASEYNVSEVIYAHIHGKHRYNDSIIGKYRGRQYSLVSGDYLNWIPKKIMG